MGIEKQTIENKDDENWINKNEFLPDFRYIAKLQNGTEYVMLIGYDTSDEDGKEIFLFSNAGFVKQQDAEKFAEWAKSKISMDVGCRSIKVVLDFYGMIIHGPMCINHLLSMKYGLIPKIVLAICS